MDDDSLDRILGVLTNAATAATAARYEQPFELQKLRLQALAANGRLYPEGYPAGALQGGGVPLGLLLIGGAVVVYLLASKGYAGLPR